MLQAHSQLYRLQWQGSARPQRLRVQRRALQLQLMQSPARSPPPACQAGGRWQPLLRRPRRIYYLLQRRAPALANRAGKQLTQWSEPQPQLKRWLGVALQPHQSLKQSPLQRRQLPHLQRERHRQMHETAPPELQRCGCRRFHLRCHQH